MFLFHCSQNKRVEEVAKCLESGALSSGQHWVNKSQEPFVS